MKLKQTPSGKQSQRGRMSQRTMLIVAASSIAALVIILIVAFNFSYIQSMFGAGNTYYSRSSGTWDDKNTWSTSSHTGSTASSAPQAGDIVIIDGHTIELKNSNASVESITLLQNKTAVTDLTISNGKSLSVGKNIEVITTGQDEKITFKVTGTNTNLAVKGDFNVIRDNANSQGAIEVVFEGSSIVNIAGAFAVDYSKGSDDVSITLANSTNVTISDLKLNTTKGQDDIYFFQKDNSVLTVVNNIAMSSDDKGGIQFNMNNTSQLNLGGGITQTGTGKAAISFSSSDSSKVNMTGTSSNPATGSTDTIVVQNLVINTPSDQPVKLAGNVKVLGSLIFQSGKAQTTTSSIIVMAQGSSVTGASDSNYVIGPISKEGNTAFTFPIGKDNIYAPLSITAPASTSTYIAEYYPTNSGEGTLGTGLTNYSQKEYWTLNRQSGTGAVKVGLTWTDGSRSGIDNPNELKVAYLNNNKWTSAGAAAINGSASKGSITSSDVSSFGSFTFGNIQQGDALPVGLIAFNAETRDVGVYLSWTTAYEENNSHFTVERSPDGKSFSELTRVEGSGNSTNKKEYAYTDNRPLGGTSYYRLKQTDLNGASETFNVESVRFKTLEVQEVFPNPFQSSFQASYSLKSEANVEITLFNSSGQQVLKEEIQGNAGQNTFRYDGNRELQPGTYILNIVAGEDKITKKIIKS